MEVVRGVLDENNKEWMVRYKALPLVKNTRMDLASFGNNSRDCLVMRDGAEILHSQQESQYESKEEQWWVVGEGKVVGEARDRSKGK